MPTYHVETAAGAATFKIARVSLRMSCALPDKQSQLNSGWQKLANQPPKHQ